MIAGAANSPAVNQSALRLGFILRRFANGGGLQLGMIGEQIFLQNFYFVVRKIGFGEVRPLLKNYNAETIGGKFLGENAASSAGTDDDEVDGFRIFVLGLIDLHFLFVSAAGSLVDARCVALAGCQPG